MPLPGFENARVALVHDWLNGMRGGEKVLEVLCEVFPNADLYTLLYEPGKLSRTIENMRIYPSFIQMLPKAFSHYRHYLPLFPMAIERFNLEGYDLIVSTSHCAAKGIKKPNETCHVSYIHAPMRYIWDQFETYFGPGKSSRFVRYGPHFLQRFCLLIAKWIELKGRGRMRAKEER